jgi:dihydropteroate synthase
VPNPIQSPVPPVGVPARSAAALRCGRFAFDLARPRVMGIVNVTPDSFSDGGRYFNRARALDHARQMMADGADLIDIGGESTRPGAPSVPEDDEIARVIPICEKLAREGIPVSVDTRKPGVMRAAIGAGAAMINDVCALTAPGALDACAAADVGVCLMHMQGDPRSMQQAPSYGDVVAEVHAFLITRAAACTAAGIARDRIVLDPGFGFGKTLAHNLALMRALPELAATGYPVLAGMSRKSALGQITGRPVDERMAASLSAALIALYRGASILRVHDVRETVDVVKVWLAIESNNPPATTPDSR